MGFRRSTRDVEAQSAGKEYTSEGEIEKFIIRQPPMGEKDDYDSENS